jgi:prefoldin subunit 5
MTLADEWFEEEGPRFMEMVRTTIAEYLEQIEELKDEIRVLDKENEDLNTCLVTTRQLNHELMEKINY